MCVAHYCRPMLGVLDNCTLIGIAPTSTPEMTFPSLPVGRFWCFWPVFAIYQGQRVVLPQLPWGTVLLPIQL